MTSRRADTPTPALDLADVTVRYGATVALDGAALVVRQGTLHAVLGENGAGKTTLVRCAYGLAHPQAGTVRLWGAARALRTPADAIRLDVGMVHQHFTLVPALTVAENVALGGAGRFDRRAAERAVAALGERTGLLVDPRRRVAELPVGAQQRVEILKALARGARLLVLDEPTAVLAPDEARELERWLRGYVAEGNTAVVVTHKLRDALAAADDVTVLRRGRTVLAAPAGALDERALLAAMLGERDGGGAAAASTPAGPPPDLNIARDAGTRGTGSPHAGTDARGAPPATAPVVLRATGLTLHRADGGIAIRDATFGVRAGEIVGIAAVEGAGQAELLRALAGRLAPAAGRLDRPARVAFVPEDRHRDALVLPFDLAENLALLDAGRAGGRVAWRALRGAAGARLASYDVRAAGVDVPAATLSGGNQQKLVLARELAGAPPAVVVENPSRGLDVRAAAAVHARLREARGAGAAVVLHSGDLDEVLALADRVLVVHAGRVREVPLDRAAVGRAMLGAEAAADAGDGAAAGA